MTSDNLDVVLVKDYLDADEYEVERILDIRPTTRYGRTDPLYHCTDNTMHN
jgi:hypothetical protein